MTRPPPLPLDEAQRRLLALAPVIPVENFPLAQAAGHYLAEPLSAARTQPAAPLSAMDGFALRSVDLPGPWTIVGESAAGHPFTGRLAPGQAIAISTGAVVPPDADMVLLKEDSAVTDAQLTLTGTPPNPRGRHIRPLGMDFREGSALLPKGTRMGAAQVALAVAAGHAQVPVRRRLRVTVIDCGDELGEAGTLLESHRIPASNGPMLAAMASALPVTVERIGPVPDRIDPLVAALDAARDADIVVTSGGASIGDHDLIRPALGKVGATIDFWRVGIKPGKPLLVARRGEQVILGLPGNPASAFVTAFLFLMPLLRATLGASHPLPRTIPARLSAPMAAGGSRMEFLRAVWDGQTVTLDPLQDSGALSPLARANALVVREARAPMAPEGSEVPVYLLDFCGIA